MVSPRKLKASKFLTVPTKPVPVDRDRSVAGLLEKMEGAGYGAKQLAEAHRIWLDMLDDTTTIFLSADGHLVPSGMRRLLAYVIKNRFVDVLIVSGSTLFHDIHETLGRNHFQAHPSMTDELLEGAPVVRMGDVLANYDEYLEADEWVGGVINQFEQGRPYSTREFLHLLGRELAEIAHEDGILTSAFKARIPIYCPDISDSEIAVGLARARFEKKIVFTFDLVQDLLELMQITHRSRITGLITLGNVSANHFARMVEVSSHIMKTLPRGHKYAISIGTDVPPPNGRVFSPSGQQSEYFGKLLRGATASFVNCDATIALSLIVTALSQTAAKYMKGRKRPNFGFAGRDLNVDIP
jgi:deoxyhypusine synthase